MVVVVDLGIPRRHRRHVERLRQRQPGLALVAAHRHRAVEAVEVVNYVGVGFQLAEIGQALHERPLVVAPFGPTVIVLGNAAQEHLAVDGAGAADHLAARNHHVLRPRRAALAGERPVVRRAHLRRPRRVAEFQVVGRLLQVNIVRPGLQEQHRAIGVFGQPGGEGAPA